MSILKLYKWYRNPIKPLTWIDSLSIEQRETIIARVKASKKFSEGEKIGFESFFEIPKLKLIVCNFAA
jgi:predicted transcriptional regulator